MVLVGISHRVDMPASGSRTTCGVCSIKEADRDNWARAESSMTPSGWRSRPSSWTVRCAPDAATAALLTRVRPGLPVEWVERSLVDRTPGSSLAWPSRRPCEDAGNPWPPPPRQRCRRRGRGSSLPSSAALGFVNCAGRVGAGV